jgi:hypothetical protein
MRAPIGSSATATVVRAGYGAENVALYTSFIAPKSCIVVRNTLTLATSLKERSNSSSSTAMLLRICFACALTSPAISLPVAGSCAICPDKKTRPGTSTECENGPTGFGNCVLFLAVMLMPISYLKFNR